MPVNIKHETIKEEGQDRAAIAITFTNGAKEQLSELKNYFKQEDELELIKLAISFLVNVKEDQEKKKGEHI